MTSEALAGLIGAALGASITLLSEWLRTRWGRVEQRRQDQIRRAEELAAFAQEIYEWQGKCFGAAVQGDIQMIPSQLFRMSLLVSAYMPSLESFLQEIAQGVAQFHQACADIAKSARNAPRQPPSAELANRVQQAMQGTCKACVKLSEATGHVLRDVVNKK